MMLYHPPAPNQNVQKLDHEQKEKTSYVSQSFFFVPRNEPMYNVPSYLKFLCVMYESQNIPSQKIKYLKDSISSSGNC